MRSIRCKVSIITFLILVFVLSAYTVIIINGLDKYVLGELLRRGVSIAGNDSGPAVYKIPSNTLRAMNDLAQKIKKHNKNILYVVVTDKNGRVKIQSGLDDDELSFNREVGQVIINENASSVKRVKRGKHICYEIQAPVVYKNRKVGDIFIGMDAITIGSAVIGGGKEFVLLTALILIIGMVGIALFVSFLIAPIRRLTEGVSMLKSGNYTGEIKVTTHDEIGFLTKQLNEVAKDIIEQKRNVEQYASNFEEAYIATLRILIAAIDARDKYTLNHSTRVAKMSLLLGKKLGFNNEELKQLQIECLFHDVGKIRMPDNVLNKSGPLNHDENSLMRKHPEYGAEILRLAESLRKYVPAVLHHHEWYNGSGYPAGLRGKGIPIHASIIGIADAYDAMMSSRPYKRGLSKNSAVEELIKFKGVQFDPNMTDNFIEVIRKFIQQD